MLNRTDFGRKVARLRDALRRLLSRSGGKGDDEARIGALIAARLRPGDTFWDLGGRAGEHTLQGARAVGPTGRLVVLEPDPDKVASLLRELPMEAAPDVTVLQGTTLDEIAGRHPRPHLLKLDIGDAQASALVAGARLWEGPSRPRCIVLTYRGREAGSRSWHFLWEHGYRLEPSDGIVTLPLPAEGTFLALDAAPGESVRPDDTDRGGFIMGGVGPAGLVAGQAAQMCL